jgi:Na+/proline symporter
VTAFIFTYVLLQMVVAMLLSRRIRTEDDYLLAGRRLGPSLAAFSIFATWFGAETCIGAAGAVYESGLSATRGDPFGYTIVIVLVAAVLAVPLWRARITTLGDLFRARYSPGVERVAVLLMVPTSILWAGAQIRAFGQVLAASSDGITASTGVALAAGTVLVYTVFGGMLADAWSDLVQGIVLGIGLLVVTVLMIQDAGGLGVALAQVPAGHFDWRAPDEGMLEVANRWAIPIVGSIAAQELVSRIVACRSPEVARRSAWMASFGYLAIGSLPVALGLMASGGSLAVSDPEQVLPALAAAHLPEIGYVVFMGALVSAILSTVDSCLLVAGSLVSHNLVVPRLPRLTEEGKLLVARLAVVASGLSAWWLALASDSVLGLVEEANGFGSAGIAVILGFALWGRFGGPRAALAALASGTLVWIAAHFVRPVPWDYLASLGAALGAYLIVAAFDHHRDHRGHGGHREHGEEKESEIKIAAT